MTSSAEQPTIPVEDAFDLLRGMAALTGSRLVSAVAETLARHPDAPLSIALNHKQIACKLWLIDAVARTFPRRLEHVLIVGGWLGTLAALMLDRMGDRIGRITSLDIDPDCKAVAETLNKAARAAGRFRAVTADMYTADLAALAAGAPAFDLVVNTSCEHIPDLGAWLATLPSRQAVALQSNDYVREPEHIACVADLDQFRAQAKLRDVAFADALPLKNYTRFMLIGHV